MKKNDLAGAFASSAALNACCMPVRGARVDSSDPPRKNVVKA